MSQTVDNESLIETAKQWVVDAYPDYPAGIRGFSQRDFSPTPTVVLNDPVDADLLEVVLEDMGFMTKRKRAQTGTELVAACVEGIDGEKDIVYTFEASSELSLDSPLRHEEPPEDGRVEIVVAYLQRAYGD